MVKTVGGVRGLHSVVIRQKNCSLQLANLQFCDCSIIKIVKLLFMLYFYPMIKKRTFVLEKGK